jgi:hypothetical protein
MTERANEAGSRVYAQGDVLLLPAADVARADAGPDLDHPVIPAEGEHTGHRHAFYGGALMFRAAAA